MVGYITSHDRARGGLHWDREKGWGSLYTKRAVQWMDSDLETGLLYLSYAPVHSQVAGISSSFQIRLISRVLFCFI